MDFIVIEWELEDWGSIPKYLTLWFIFIARFILFARLIKWLTLLGLIEVQINWLDLFLYSYLLLYFYEINQVM